MNITKKAIKKLFTIFLAAGILISAQAVVLSQEYNGINRIQRKPDCEILVGYNDSRAIDNVLDRVRSRFSAANIRSKRKYELLKIQMIEVDRKGDVEKVLEELKRHPDVKYAQPNYKLFTNDIPTDGRFPEQWGLLNSGQVIKDKEGVTGVDINAVMAWKVSQGSAETIVGVLDTGIDIMHPDLDGNIWTNPGEIPDNGVDDDNNGFVDDIHGWDFVNDDNTVFDSTESDTHGTHVAGTIAAELNGKGTVGVAYGAKILPLKFMNGNYGYTSDAIEAIEYARRMGVSIINASFGSIENNPALKEAMSGNDILFVCAAGNQGNEVPVYPASFRLPNILSVTAIDNTGELAEFASYGINVHVAAPGVDITGTVPEGGYTTMSGTSMSAAYVSGIAALMKSYAPDVTPNDMAYRIKSTVVKTDALKGKIATRGYVNGFEAVTSTETAPPDGQLPPDDEDGSTGDGELSALAAEIEENLVSQIHYGEEGVNAASGNFSYLAVDMSVDAPGFVINFSRTYNSLDDKALLMGRGWTFGFEGSIRTCPYKSNWKEVRLPDGSVQMFTDNGDGTYTANDSRSRLEKLADNTFKLTTKDLYTYEFTSGSTGYLYRMTDRNGNVVNIDVNASGKISKITDGALREYTLEYNAQNLITKITGPADRTVRYEYENNLLVRAIDPTGKITRYEYDSNNFLNVIKDHNSNTIAHIEYDHSGGANNNRVIHYTNIHGNTFTYNYDDTFYFDEILKVYYKQTVITDSNQRQITKWCDKSYSIVKTIDPEGRETIVTYYRDSNGDNKYREEASIIDRNGNVTIYQRDARGNITGILTGPVYTYRKYVYDDKDNLIEEVDEEGKRTFYIYDQNKVLLKKKVQPLDGISQYIDGTSNPAYFAITEYSYYSNAEAQSLGYKAKGLLKEIKDANGNITSMTYDANGYIATVTDQEGKVTTHHYNETGFKEYTITPEGVRTDIIYDNNGRPLKTTIYHTADPSKSSVTRMEYDIEGRKIQEVSPNQYNPSKDGLPSSTSYNDDTAGTRYVYNPQGLLQSVTDPEGNTTSYIYDLYGNLDREIKPNGSIYDYDYDIMNRLTKVWFKENSGAASVLLEEYAYTILADHRTQKTHTKYLNDTDMAVTIYIYDFKERLVEQQNPDGTRIYNTYNLNGTLKSITDVNGYTTYYIYDGLNRLVKQWRPVEAGDNEVLYTYTRMTYDKVGNKIEEKVSKQKTPLYHVPDAGSFITVTNTYYRNGKLKEVTNSAGQKTEYLYDDDWNVIKETVYMDATHKNITEYAYNYLGKVSEKKVHVRAGDIYPNNFEDNTDTVLITKYSYDKNGNVIELLTPDNISTEYTYDNMNRVLSTSKPGLDEYGNPTTIITSRTYNWEGYPLTETDAKGNVTSYTYNKRGFLEKITAPGANGGTTAYWYDTAGRKTAEVSPVNYDPAKSLQQMNRTEYTYDLMGRMKTKVQKYYDIAVSQWITITSRALKYNNSGNVVKELDALGYDSGTGSTVDERINSGYGTEYTYNLANKVLTVLDPESKLRGLAFTTRYEYDALGRMVSETDANGRISKYGYDDAGNMLFVKRMKNSQSAEQLVESNTYDLLGNKTATTDGNGNTTTFEYNALGQIRKTTTPGDYSIPSNTIIFQYDTMGRPVYRKDIEGTVDTYTYDSFGRVLTHTQKKSDGTEAITVSTRYDKNGNARYETDGNGVTVEKTYDEQNRLKTEKITVSGTLKTTGYTYDKNGNVLTMTDWLGNTQKNIYDPLGRLVERKDAYDISIQKLEYDRNGAQVKSWDALGNLTQYAYDRNVRLISTTDPKGDISSQTYDNVGNIATRTDGENNTTTYSYDEFNRLKTVTNAKNEVTTYTYDLNGNMLSQSDGKGNTTRFEYNVANKLIKRIDPGGIDDPAKTETYTYYTNGLMKTKTDRNGKTTNYTCDSHGRLKSQTIGSDSISYTYDGNGNLLTVTDSSTGTITREYDEENRVKKKTVTDIGTSTYVYDILDTETGCVRERSTDPKGNVTEKVYDRAGRLWKVISGSDTTTYTYYDNGSLEKVQYLDGSYEYYTYYADNTLWTLTNKKRDGSTMDLYTYTYDGAGNQLSKEEIINGINKGITYYTYDELNRLETVTEPEGRETVYTYDAAGNRETETVTQSGSSITTTYTYNEQNRLLKTEKVDGSTSVITTYSYDNNGNMLSSKVETISTGGGSRSYGISVTGEDGAEGVSIYTYDVWNRLVGAKTGDRTVINAYNGEGYRIRKTVNGETTKYLYEYDKVVLEVDGSGNQTARNVYGTNLLSRTVDGQSLWYMYNGHGDVTALLDSVTGNIVATYYYDAFGNIAGETGTVNNPIRYAGYQWDDETGLYYLNARYYDSKIARFLSEDTYRGTSDDPLSLNLYTYCFNNPVLCFLRGTIKKHCKRQQIGIKRPHPKK